MKSPASTSIPPAARVRARLASSALLAACALLPARVSAQTLIKADNTTNMGADGSYTTAGTPVAGSIIVFDDTLVTNSTFSWTGNTSVNSLRVEDPANAVTINIAPSSFTFSNSGGTVVDLSSATANLTLAASSLNGHIRVRGTTGHEATVSIANGRTLGMQARFYYNNTADNVPATIRVTGAGNFTVGGTFGTISDKPTGTGQTTALKLETSGTVTLSNLNTFSGGTTLSAGTLVTGVAGALGSGSFSMTNGALDLNGSGIVDLTLADNRNFSMSNGTLRFDLGTSSDQISGGGTGFFDLDGGTIHLTPGVGFSYASTYQLFQGFNAGASSVGALAFTGFDTGAYSASLNTAGQLSFTAVPEPSAFATLLGSFALLGVLVRRRRPATA